MTKNKELRDSVIKDYSYGRRFEYAASIERGLSNFEQSLITNYIKSIGGHILILGCGGGRETFALKKQGFEVSGLDINSKLINSAIEKSNDLDLQIDFKVGNMSSLPYPDNRYDHVLIFEQSLGHVPGRRNRVNAINECYRVIKKDGYLIFSTYYRYSSFRRAIYLSYLDVLRFINQCLLKPVKTLEYSDWKIKNKGYVNMPSQSRTKSEISQTKFDLVDVWIEPNRRNSFFICRKI